MSDTCRHETPVHPQTPFLNHKGEMVEVDKEIFFILACLNDVHGVRTQYSCQGDEFPAYVLADARSFNRFIRKILCRYFRGGFSKEGRETIRRFLRGRREFEFAFFTDHGNDLRFGHALYFGNDWLQRYAYECSMDNHWGRRVTLRWPTEDNDRIYRLLLETRE